MEKTDTHWDYVLKEAGWLANDFQKERVRHVTRAKRLVKSVETYHRGTDARRERKAKEEALQVRRLSSRMSKEVRRFWLKIDRIIAFKQKGDFDEIRQKAMDKHLVFIVKQTERYTNMIAENMRTGGQGISTSLSEYTKGKKRSLDKGSNSGTPLKKVRFEEKEISDESGTTYEDLESSQCEVVEPSESQPSSDDSSGSDEYVGEEEPDDETTLIEEEGRAKEMSYEEEMALLQQDQGLPIEQLRSMYAKASEQEFSDEETPNRFDSDGGSECSDESSTHSRESCGDAISRLEAADEAARSVHVDRPFLLSASLYLREYQHIGLNWLVSLHERRLNGILADEMGLGKTIQTIALLAYLACYKGIWGPHLIVVPTSCLINWETEFKKFCPGFKILPYYGSVKTRKFLRTGWSRLNSFHVCVTSYQLVVQDSKAFRKKRWYYMILDEAHNIKVITT